MSELDVRTMFYFAEEGDHAPEGMGWYLASVYRVENSTVEIIPRVRLAPKEVEKLSKVIDNFAKNKPLNWSLQQGFVRGEDSLATVVQRANSLAAERATQRLAEAEDAVRKLEALRARAGEFETEDKKTVAE